MKRFVLLALLFVSPPALSDDWVLLSSDELYGTYIHATSITRTAEDEVRFRIKFQYRKKRDMMGLPYTVAIKDYVIGCASNLVLSEQHFLLNGDEIVWTFPQSSKKAKADVELPKEVIGRVCR